MELDKRIIECKKPLTCFDTEQAKEFLGKECYFSNCKSHYKNLSAFEKYVTLTDYCIGTLTAVMDLGDRVFDVDQQCKEFRYCLPCEWVKSEEPEKKYRPYSIKDFEKAFMNEEFDDFIILRDKYNPDDIYTLRYNGNFRKGQFEYICLGAKNFSFESLLENYEVADYDGDWQPFGVEVKEQE